MSSPDLMSLLLWLCDICLAGAVVGCLFTVLECACVLGFGRGQIGRSAAQPAVTVLKPLHGLEPDLPARLAAFCDQNYVGSIQVVLGGRKDTAAVAAIVRDIKAKFPDKAVELVSDTRSHGSNGKIEPDQYAAACAP